MKHPSLVLVAAGVMLIVLGCTPESTQSGPAQDQTTGFLSDYSKLRPDPDGSHRYINQARLPAYSGFIIDEVVPYAAPGIDPRVQAQLRSLAQYMRQAIIDAISDRYPVVTRPGPGVARVRVAITDFTASVPTSSVLYTLIEYGRGGAAMEAEVIDSRTGEQIGAVIESAHGDRVSLVAETAWDDAIAVMDTWAQRFRARLDEAHTR